MLIYSYLFLFLFLPVTLLGYYLIGKLKYPRIAVVWLIAASLLFYGLYNYLYVVLILFSILSNYTIGRGLASQKLINYRRLILAAGIVINVLLLGYFKYINVFIDTANFYFGIDFHFRTIILPLAISFFTLQQIAYLVDAYRGEIGKHNFFDYCLFVTFFPKLISGPIVRFKEMVPQIVEGSKFHVTRENIAVGLTVLFMGLFKKIILADTIGQYADFIFDGPTAGISFVHAWIGALSYTFQLYFDFSGYCDIAIGLGLMFGIRLPLNFYSPYRATSVQDFWRRWHITLSRFLRDYLYIPLGGNRRGFPRQVVNLLLVMTIAGLWHGADQTFIVWGALHGLYLVINHSWRRLKEKLGYDLQRSSPWGTAISMLVTFVAVTVAWVFFRAGTLTTAVAILQGMTGMNGFIFSSLPASLHGAVIWVLASLVICWFLPNLQEYMAHYQPALDSFYGGIKKARRWLRWEPSLWRAVIIAGMAIWAMLNLSQVSEFIYFQF